MKHFSYLHIFSPSSTHLFTSSHLLVSTPALFHIFSSSHLLTFTPSRLLPFLSSHLLICISSRLHTSSSLHLYIFSPSHLLIFAIGSPAHTLFQDRFQDVQVGSRWFSTLYILSPNFHTKRSSHDASGSKLGSNFSTQLGRTTSWSPRPMFYSSENEILQWPYLPKLAQLWQTASPEGTTVSHCHTINHG